MEYSFMSCHNSWFTKRKKKKLPKKPITLTIKKIAKRKLIFGSIADVFISFFFSEKTATF